MAILFRSGFHSYKLEIELASQGFEFDKRGGLKLTESAHIKDLLSFFRLVINPWDNLSWNRILLQLDKVGPKTANKMLETIRESDTPGGRSRQIQTRSGMERTVCPTQYHAGQAHPARAVALGSV